MLISNLLTLIPLPLPKPVGAQQGNCTLASKKAEGRVLLKDFYHKADAFSASIEMITRCLSIYVLLLIYTSVLLNQPFIDEIKPI